MEIKLIIGGLMERRMETNKNEIKSYKKNHFEIEKNSYRKKIKKNKNNCKKKIQKIQFKKYDKPDD